MKNLLKTLIFATTLAIGFSADTCAMDPKNTVLTVDHDDVINIKNKLGFIDYAKYMLVIGKVALHSPRGAAGLLWNWGNVQRRGAEVAKRVQGTSNIIYTLAQELKNEGYVDLTPYVEEMTAITVKPSPIWPMINELKKLKEQGYTIIGATNQDYYQNKAFREKMAAQGVNLSDIFTATVVAHTLLKADEIKADDAAHEIEQGIYMPASPNGHKVYTDYFDALRQVAQKHAPGATVLAHTDDKLENVQTAQKAGFKGLHFKLPDGKTNARHCTKEELAATCQDWKSQIQKMQ